MQRISLFYPKKIVFGNDSLNNFWEDFISSGLSRLFIVTTEPVMPLILEGIYALEKNNVEIKVDGSIASEPSVNTVKKILHSAREHKAEGILGIGGGSVLDVAKIIAALLNNNQNINDTFGIGRLSGRSTYLACIPTTSGTGSEMSPNAILLDPSDNQKKGVISPFLIADAVYVDPKLTLTLPPFITATTGMDALIHCLEAYTNKFAHPIVDLYALKGIELIASNLKRACDNGSDIEARNALALGSMYGGMCLGPVNTAAVHAISYPLGGEYHIAHGLSTSLILPYVMEFNTPASVSRYAEVAFALGCDGKKTDEETAYAGIEKIKRISESCGLPQKLSEVGIPYEALSHIAGMAMGVTRLLKNNVREVTYNDVMNIYEKAY